MATYQDVINADLPLGAWALTEASGTDFVPYTGPYHLTGSGTLLYRQTGPFGTALALHLAAGASLRTNSLLFPSSGGTIECWIRLDTYPPASTVALEYWGNSGSNGNGVIVQTSGDLQLFAAPSNTLDAFHNFASGWHLVQIGNPGPNGGSALAVDGAIIVSKIPGVGGTAGNPDQIGFGCTASSTAAVALSVAYPAVYPTYLTSQFAYAHFLAASDPNTAINFTLTGLNSNSALLQLIYAAVHRVFPTT